MWTTEVSFIRRERRKEGSCKDEKRMRVWQEIVRNKKGKRERENKMRGRREKKREREIQRKRFVKMERHVIEINDIMLIKKKTFLADYSFFYIIPTWIWLNPGHICGYRKAGSMNKWWVYDWNE